MSQTLRTCNLQTSMLYYPKWRNPQIILNSATALIHTSMQTSHIPTTNFTIIIFVLLALAVTITAWHTNTMYGIISLLSFILLASRHIDGEIY